MDEKRVRPPASGLFVDAEGAWFHDGSPVRHARLAALLHRSIARDAEGTLVVTTGRDVLPITSEDAPLLVDGIRFTPDGVVWRFLGGQEQKQSGALLFCPDSRFRFVAGDLYALVLRGPHQALQTRLEERDGGMVIAAGRAPAIPVTVLEAMPDVHRPLV